MSTQPTFETRFHVEILNEHGVPVKLDPMPLEEFQAFQDEHWMDSLDYEYDVITSPA